MVCIHVFLDNRSIIRPKLGKNGLTGTLAGSSGITELISHPPT